jgi:putative SOS response-associated peptidase YedK
VDKLEDRHNWQRLFMHRHAALLVKSFYEWVPDPQEAGKSAQVEFFPLEGKPLWVPALWDEWCAPNGEYRIRSFAILTREPPAEIQAVGHDRCPVFPRHDLLKTWLHPEQYRREEYYQLFNQLEPVSYGHRFLSLL